MAQTRTDPAEVQELVDRARTGDRDAFGDLYRLYHAGVYRMVSFHVPGPSANDVVSETFLRAWAAIPRYKRTGAPFVAWLLGIARHVIVDAHRAARRVEPRDVLPDRAVEFEGRSDDRLSIARAVAKLSREQRAVIELKFLLGLTNDEVGAAMDKSAGAINTLQWRALAKLKRIMESR